MTLLEQCEIWNDREEYQSIIDAIEALPKEERTPELDSELARACNNIADVGDRALFEKAAELLKPHEAYFAGDHNWNFRLHMHIIIWIRRGVRFIISKRRWRPDLGMRIRRR